MQTDNPHMVKPCMTHKEVEVFFNKIEEQINLDTMHLTIFQLLYGTGIKLEQALKLNRAEIDLIKGKITTDHPIPLATITAALLKIYAEDVRPIFAKKISDPAVTNRFFLSKEGDAVTPDTVEELFCKIARDAGLKERYTPDCFAHLYSYYHQTRGRSK